jgi:alkanesulfonate monooxygenase SsuD/methylene tetrahydromethanopterin reductase-like flavin-dependent oxidoreductase (luciferase family)
MPTTAVTPLDRVGAQLPASYAAWKKAGQDRKIGPMQVNCLVPTYCAETREKAVEEMKPFEMWYFGKLIEFFAPKPGQTHSGPVRPGGDWWNRPNWDYITGERMVICGDPRDCVEQLKEYEQAGINRVMCQFQVGGMPHTMVMEAMRLWGEEVIPYFQSR